MNSLPSRSKAKSAAFDLLHEKVQRWIWQRGWEELRDIQEKGIPIILRGEQDVIIAAATAGGKTEAAFLPIISRIGDNPGKGFRALYVSPLKALINDQFRRVDDLCDEMQLPVFRWHGDVSVSVKRRARETPSGILLITPESLEALFTRRPEELGRMFAPLEYVVIDELHAFIGSERGIHLLSLLHRLETLLGREITRIGLSATLGDMALAAEFIRCGHRKEVEVLVSKEKEQELKLQLRGHIRRGATSGTDIHAKLARQDSRGERDQPSASTQRDIAEHLFQKLRGGVNLVFAGSRQNVEIYSDLLRQISEREKVPNEFFPHHSNLSREHREEIEVRLREGLIPTTAVCTTTLELGIDIGEIENVAQIGPPWSVAGMRQRLGRSGRRPDKAAVMRMYIAEEEITGKSHPLDALRVGLVQSVAMVNLLLRGWYEPPVVGRLHLSTLVHQTLSLITQYGGVTPARAYEVLCRTGPFRSVTADLFNLLLRRMGDAEVRLVEQAPDETLLLGARGERIVEHYSFFAVFQTPEEYRIVTAHHTIGTLPVVSALWPGVSLIFGGRRWGVVDVRTRDRIIEVEPAAGGRPPRFGGEGVDLHDAVTKEMYNVYIDEHIPIYLDKQARELLTEGRDSFRRFGLARKSLATFGKNVLVFPWCGSVKLNTLALALKHKGLSASTHGVVVEVEGRSESEVTNVLRSVGNAQEVSKLKLASLAHNKEEAKYDRFLDEHLLNADYASRRIDESILEFPT